MRQPRSLAPTTQLLLKSPQAWLTLHGEYDLASHEELTQRFLDIDDLACHEVYLDAGAVTFIDCSTLGLIAAAKIHLADDGGTLTVTQASPWVRRICRLSGYEGLLSLTADRP
jgi:anti-anti-sigma factor